MLRRTSPLGEHVARTLQCYHYAFSVETVRELSEVALRSKFDRYLSQQARLEILKGLAKGASWFTPTEIIRDCRDSADNKFLELAIAAEADFLITGDEDLLLLDPFRKIRILTITEFAQDNLPNSN